MKLCLGTVQFGMDYGIKGQKQPSLDEALKSDCVVLITDHDEYKNLTPKQLNETMFVCTRPILNPEYFRKEGVIFVGVGRA